MKFKNYKCLHVQFLYLTDTFKLFIAILVYLHLPLKFYNRIFENMLIFLSKIQEDFVVVTCSERRP